MGGVSAALYLAMNYFSSGGVIADAVTAIGILIAFYYGATGFACTWYYRRELTASGRDFLLKGLIPFLGGLMLWVGMVLTTIQDWKPVNSYVVWVMHFAPHWQIGFAFLLGIGSLVVGVILMIISIPIYRDFFSGRSLNRATPVYVVEGEPLTAGSDAARFHRAHGAADRSGKPAPPASSSSATRRSRDTPGCPLSIEIRRSSRPSRDGARETVDRPESSQPRKDKALVDRRAGLLG